MIPEGFNITRSKEPAGLRFWAKSLDLDQGAALRDFLKELTSKVGHIMPDNVVLGLTPNFLVTPADVTCLDGLLTGRTLYISLPLSRILTRSEMASSTRSRAWTLQGIRHTFQSKVLPGVSGDSTINCPSSRGIFVHDEGGLALLPAL